MRSDEKSGGRRPRAAGRKLRRASADGDLAAELLNAAAELITERGPQGFSLREIARRARVSEAAPYWHFASKEALLAAVAEQGFVGLADALVEARDRTTAPARRLRELGVAYVRFAVGHPSHVRIMFGPEIPDKAAYPALQSAAARAFGLLVQAITEGQTAGYVRDGDLQDLAISAWAMVHGLSALLIDGQLRKGAVTPRDTEGLAGRVTELLEIGLARR